MDTGEEKLRVAHVADVLKSATNLLAGLVTLETRGGARGDGVDEPITSSYRLVRDGRVYRVTVTEED